MSAVGKILTFTQGKKRVSRVIGFVAGIIWPADDMEWLASAKGLSSFYNDREPTKIYKTKEQAEKRREQLLVTWGEKYQPFVREYILESWE